MATNTEKIVVQVQVKGVKDLDLLEKKTGTSLMAVGKLTKGFAKMAGGIAIVVTAFKSISTAVAASIKTFRDFEFQMAKVRAVTGASNTDFKKLSGTAQELGRTTFFTATQVAELQTNFAKLGFTTEEILDAQKATLDLATATGSDLARAATVAGASVRGFGLDASETQRVVDVMAVAFTSSAMDIEKWQTSMTKVAPIAKASGFSIEDTAAMMSKLTDAGIEASIAGTSLRNILLKMQDPNSDLTRSFGKTIHSFDELVPAMKNFVKEGGNMADIMEVVDLRQAAAFEQMITSADSTENLRDKLLQANGAAADMAEIVGDNLEGAFKRLTSALEGLAINLTEGFIGDAITGFIEMLTTGVSAINELIGSTESVEEITGKAAKAFSDESKALNKLVKEYDDLSTKVNKTNEDKIRLNVILGNLKTKYGNSVVSINKQTGALKLNRDALDAVINRTALLADEEAIKLVRIIRKNQKAVDDQTASYKESSGALRNNQLLLKEITKSETDKAKADVAVGHGIEFISGAVDENNIMQEQNLTANERSINQNAKIVDQQKVVNKEIKRNSANLSKLNKLELERNENVQRLLDIGWTMAEVQDALNQEQEISTDITVDSTAATQEDIRVIKDKIDIERELHDFIMNQGVLSEEQQINARKRINKLRQEEIELQLKALNQFVMNVDLRKKLLAELAQLKSEDFENDEKQKQEAFEADVKRAIMSGQTAVEAMKTVVRAQIMEAIAGYISSIFQSMPFPINLILAAGASALIGNLIDKQLNRFGNGGMIEEYANGGMVHGRSHAQGGEKFAVGGRVVELEGGEAVINKRSTAMFRNQLSAMNTAGGGVKFADGGMLNNPAFAQQQFNALGQSQMMGAMGGQSKVVVVEADITESQNTVSVIQSDARI